MSRWPSEIREFRDEKTGRTIHLLCERVRLVDTFTSIRTDFLK
jgi:hypothetical protein